MTDPASARRPGSLLRWVVVILAVLVGSTILSTLFLLRCAPDTPDRPAEPAAAPVPDDTTTAVHAALRNVDYHVDQDIVLRIRYLRGWLVPTRKGTPPVFEDGDTYVMRIDAAEIAIDTASLGRLLNRYVFGYRGAPIRDLHVSVDGDELVQKGKLGNLPFTIHSAATVTPQGEIRLHPTDVKVLGINADGLMDRLGLELEEMLKLRPGHGARVEENDFLLDPATMLPPPRIRGTLAAIRLVPDGMVQRFGPPDSLPPGSFFGISAPVENYMSYRGAVIRFGKLTMTGTDLSIVDADPSDRFGFYLGRYHEQLVAGDHRTTPEDGLVVRMPDIEDLK